MDCLSMLPRDIWELCAPKLESPDIFCLYATGSANLQASLRATVRRMDIGIVSRRSLTLWPSLKEISAGVVGPPAMRLVLTPFLSLEKLAICHELESIDIDLSDLKCLTYLEAPQTNFEKYIENCVAPLKTLICDSAGNLTATALARLPDTLTRLELPVGYTDEPLTKPLPAAIETLRISSAFFNPVLPSLGLPPQLKGLHIIANSSPATFIADLPRTLTSLVGSSFSYVDSQAALFFPPALTCLQLNSSRLTDQDLIHLPRTIIDLYIMLNFRITPSSLSHLPQALTRLNLSQTMTMNNSSITLLPTTITDLTIPNGDLSGQAISKLPPRLEVLSITTHALEPTIDQPWVPFIFDPEHMSKIPFTLKTIKAPIKEPSPLSFHLLERFPPTLQRITSSGWLERIYTVLLDLREVTHIAHIKHLTETLHAEAPEPSDFGRIIVYIAYPRTIEFSQETLTRVDKNGPPSNTNQTLTQHKCHDILAFMKKIQQVYDTVASCATSSPFGDHMTHIMLLPSADLSSLPSVQMIVSPVENIRLRSLYPGTLMFVGERAIHVRSQFVERLSLSSFRLVNDVAVGGTFDHMHTGHRMLLSTCLLTARKRLTIGVTGAPLLVKKQHKDYLQTFAHRCQNVGTFCRLQRDDLFLDIVEILDPAGPTATDPNYDVIVVSEETAAGVPAINDIRAKKGFKPMEGLVIHLAESYGTMKDLSSESKISSTTLRLRERLLDEQLYKENTLAVAPERLSSVSPAPPTSVASSSTPAAATPSE